jgi:hypothetical protein
VTVACQIDKNQDILVTDLSLEISPNVTFPEIVSRKISL